MSTLSVFGGTGFIGSSYVSKFPSILIGRDCLDSQSDDILYLISTIDNYNVLDNPTLDIETNLIHFVKVLECNKKKLKCVNFVSSWFVYGDSELPAKETSVCNPKGFYSITKKCAEDLLISFCKTHNINYRIFRLTNVYGKNDHKVSKKKNALQFLVNKMKMNEPIDLYYGGHFYRDYMHVDDVCNAINHLVNYGEANSIYNIGTGDKIEFIEIINKVKDVIKSSSEIRTVEPSNFHKIVQVKDSLLDVSKLKSTNFKDAVSILDNIESIL
jgi:nucleoside-diphosphate-sugar epimerase